MDRLEYFKIFFEFINNVNPMTEFDQQLCFDHFEVEKFDKNTIIEKLERFIFMKILLFLAF